MEENKKPENPSVYPSTETKYFDTSLTTEKYEVSHAGMTLRDHFAGLAMQGHLASEYGAGVHCNKENQEYLAKSFYDMADAMLKQREL